jgi:hypothetical protein
MRLPPALCSLPQTAQISVVSMQSMLILVALLDTFHVRFGPIHYRG